MNKEEQLQFLLEHGIVAIVRIKEPGELVRVAEAIEAGGVNLDNIEQFISAGAVAVGGNLVESRFIRAKDWAGLTENERLYTEAIKRARDKAAA